MRATTDAQVGCWTLRLTTLTTARCHQPRAGPFHASRAGAASFGDGCFCRMWNDWASIDQTKPFVTTCSAEARPHTLPSTTATITCRSASNTPCSASMCTATPAAASLRVSSAGIGPEVLPACMRPSLVTGVQWQCQVAVPALTCLAGDGYLHMGELSTGMVTLSTGLPQSMTHMCVGKGKDGMPSNPPRTTVTRVGTTVGLGFSWPSVEGPGATLSHLPAGLCSFTEHTSK